MKRLVRSSVQGAVDRDAAVHLLVERTVLTRAVCRELLDADGHFADQRPGVALGFLLGWVQQHLPESIHIEPHASDGIDRMVVPDDCQALLLELRAGAKVSEDLFMLHTADSSLDWDEDMARLHASLKAYWEKFSTAAPAPDRIPL